MPPLPVGNWTIDVPDLNFTALTAITSIDLHLGDISRLAHQNWSDINLADALADTYQDTASMFAVNYRNASHWTPGSRSLFRLHLFFFARCLCCDRG